MNGDNSSEADSQLAYKVYTMDFIFKKLNEFGEENSLSLVWSVAGWKLKTTENVLHSLLKNSLDSVAW